MAAPGRITSSNVPGLNSAGTGAVPNDKPAPNPPTPEGSQNPIGLGQLPEPVETVAGLASQVGEIQGVASAFSNGQLGAPPTGFRNSVFANNNCARYGAASVSSTSAIYKAPTQTVLVPVLGGITATFLNSNDEGQPGAGSITMGFSILDSSGAYHQFTVGGETTWTLAAGHSVTTDPHPSLSFEAGATFNAITWVSSTTEGQWPFNSATAVFYNGTAGTSYAGSYVYGAPSSDLAGGASFPFEPGGVSIFAPSSIQGVCAEPTRAVALVGDSWLERNGYLNFAVLSLDPLNVPWINCGLPGDTLAAWVGSEEAGLLPALTKCSDVINEYCTNDFNSTAGHLATVQADVIEAAQQFLANGAQRVFQCTAPPYVTGSSGSQTLTASNPDRQAFNAWLRGGAPVNALTLAVETVGTAGALLAGQPGHPLAGYIDTDVTIESPYLSGYWNPAYFDDGIHPADPVGDEQVSLAVSGSMFGGEPTNYTPPAGTQGLDTFFPNKPYTALVNTLTLTVGKMWHVPFKVDGDTPSPTITRFYVNISTDGSTGASLRLAIYNADSRGRPTSLYLDCGTQAAITGDGGPVFTTISTQLPPGHYTMAVYTEGDPSTPPAIQGATGADPMVPASAFQVGSNAQNCYEYTVSGSQVGAPETLTDSQFSAFGTTAPLLYLYTSA